MKISYLITCSTETDTLKRLVERIYNNLGSDELVILQDEYNWDIKRKKYLTDITELNNTTSEIQYLPIFVHPLNSDYGTHKNFGNSKCSGDYIFQLDGDELPPENIIGENLHSIIESNPEIELIFVPRINDFKGVKEEHAKQWSWRLTNSKKDGIAQGRPLVNWCDYQGRIYKNIIDRIKWDRKLHEKIEGHNQYSMLPSEEDYAIYHNKTIEKQIETNLRYNKVFTVEDNMGHKVI
jgi:glycosyltransferase involved in cell wall biosynthesis